MQTVVVTQITYQIGKYLRQEKLYRSHLCITCNFECENVMMVKQHDIVNKMQILWIEILY